MNSDLLYVMYMGGPDSLEAIQPFLYNLFTDRDIINFGIGNYPQKLLAKIISNTRSKKVAPEYSKIGGGSPQLPILKKLMTKVSYKYQNRYGSKLSVEFGMCYYHPYIKDTIKSLYQDKFNNIFVMTMYPQYSYTTSGACFRRFYDNIISVPPTANLKIIPFWHLNQQYNQCLIDHINIAAAKISKETNSCHILFSAHSLPLYTLEKGDLYTSHLHAQVNYIVQKVRPKSFSISYQSKAGRMKWLEPSTKHELEALYNKQCNNIIVIPISFVSDHIETLIELDEQYLKEARDKGMNIVRIESLNDSESFADAILSIIKE